MNAKKTTVLGSILMVLLFFAIPLSKAAEPELGGGRISLIQGQVLIQGKDEGGWTEAFVNFPIMDGDRLMTERDGRVELLFKNGTYIRVGELSQIDLIALNEGLEKDFIHLHQLEGIIYVNHRPITGKASSLFVDLPYGVVSAYVPSKFRIDLTPFEARISVLEGSVEWMRNGKPISLAQGKTLIAREGGFAEVTAIFRRDEWDQWNEARDYELLQRGYTQQYLPPELEPYGYEMEGNGRWVYTPEYQYVWVPTVVVGWAPFNYGHWFWRRGIYCWIPHEPWGWIPFHYGRWVHLHLHGWAWVPPYHHAVIWHPGAVAWHIGPAIVSWVPLAPGEIYYGHHYYGPHSVNIHQASIPIQNNVYINAKVKNAVVTVSGDSFNRRNPSKVTSVENPFLKPAKVSGSPTEKPVSLEGKKTPLRPVKGSFERTSREVKSSPKVIQPKQTTERPIQKVVRETAGSQVERTDKIHRPTDSAQGNLVKREPPSGLPKESVRKESPVPNAGGNKNIPNVTPEKVRIPNEKGSTSPQGTSNQNVSRNPQGDRFEKTGQFNPNQDGLKILPSPRIGEGTQVKSPNATFQGPQRNPPANAEQTRFERAKQPRAFPGGAGASPPSSSSPERKRVESFAPIQSFSQTQGERVNAGRISLPEVRLPSVPESKGQVIQPQRGRVGGVLGSSPVRSFR